MSFMSPVDNKPAYTYVRAHAHMQTTQRLCKSTNPVPVLDRLTSYLLKYLY